MSQRTSPVRRARTYVRTKRSELNHPQAFPIVQQLASEQYRPVAPWLGRLILPKRMERRPDRGVWFEIYHAPDTYQALVGQHVWLRWSADPQVQARVWAVTRDVLFIASTYASVEDGLVLPERLNGWLLVGPLESLAGARPVDDMVVALRGPIEVFSMRDVPDDVELAISHEPLQVTGRFYGLVRFVAPLETSDDSYCVVHFNRTTRLFDGAETVVRLPQVVPNENDLLPAVREGIEQTALNDDGWYIYGAQDRAGVFVVQALAPRRLLRVQPERVIREQAAAQAYLKRGAWEAIVAEPGKTQSVLLAPGAVDEQMTTAAWQAGDRALVLHLYGGIGGPKTEPNARGPVYFGHFAYGIAQVVHEPLADELIFDVIYKQVYTHNIDGLTAGALAWSRYMGDRQYGWLGIRPVCDVLIKLDAFNDIFDIYGVQSAGLDLLMGMLEVMTARYRTGDGRGVTYVAAANNCSQDSNQALYGAIKRIEALVTAQPDLQAWLCEHPAEAQRFARLLRLGKLLQRRLLPFGSGRADWQYNAETLGISLEDGLVDNVVKGVLTWRTLLPRVANNTVASALVQAGASAWVLCTSQVGGLRSDIAPIAPLTFARETAQETD